MITLPDADFNKDTKGYLDKVAQDYETLIIKRGKDTGVAILPLQEYIAWEATGHELSSKQNQKRLDAAISKFKKGDTFERNLIEK